MEKKIQKSKIRPTWKSARAPAVGLHPSVQPDLHKKGLASSHAHLTSTSVCFPSSLRRALTCLAHAAHAHTYAREVGEEQSPGERKKSTSNKRRE